MWQVAFRGRQPSTKAIVVSDRHSGFRFDDAAATSADEIFRKWLISIM